MPFSNRFYSNFRKTMSGVEQSPKHNPCDSLWKSRFFEKIRTLTFLFVKSTHLLGRLSTICHFRPDLRVELNSLPWTLTFWSCKMASSLTSHVTLAFQWTLLTCAVMPQVPESGSEPPPAVWATLPLPHTQKLRTPPRCQTPRTPSLVGTPLLR